MFTKNNYVGGIFNAKAEVLILYLNWLCSVYFDSVLL